MMPNFMITFICPINEVIIDFLVEVGMEMRFVEISVLSFYFWNLEKQKKRLSPQI